MESNEKKIKDFYFGTLVNAFPKDARKHLADSFHKHLFEVLSVLGASEGSSSPPSFLDVGAGAGVNAIILHQVFGYRCTVVDRFLEFSPAFKREVGDSTSVVSRLKGFGVHTFQHDFISKGFPFSKAAFDIITCFDVIEHFNFSPKKVISDIANLLKPGGVFLVGTPNQAHLYNRVKLFCGRNVWEDFDYYYSAENFFGHIREYIPAELETLVSREPALAFEHLAYSNYPVESRIKRLQSKVGNIPANLLHWIIRAVVYLMPKLNYYMIAFARRKP